MIAKKDKDLGVPLMAFLVSSGASGVITSVFDRYIDLNEIDFICLVFAIGFPLFVIIESLATIAKNTAFQYHENDKKEVEDIDKN